MIDRERLADEYDLEQTLPYSLRDDRRVNCVRSSTTGYTLYTI
jgi:hypothetical protein